MKQHSLLAVIISTTLVACGGGSGSDGSSSTPVSNTGNSGLATSSSSSAAGVSMAQGMITGFGSVIVNGVHFDVKDASINVDDSTEVESGLAVGQIVRIVGDVDADGLHGKATKLVGESQLRGPIDSIDLTNGVIVALGQTILINGDTFYADGATAASLKVGDVVKVNSHTDANGNLVATRVVVVTGSAAAELLMTGEVANLDTTAMTFTINGTLVDYSKANLSDLANKTIANGLVVRVHGTISNGVFIAAGSLRPSILDLKHDGDVNANVGLEVSGLVTDLVADTSFTLDTTKVLFTSSTKFEGGTSADIANGLRVRVAGKLDSDKNLVANNIKLIFNPHVDDEGLVQSVDLTANTFTLNGVTFEVNVDTAFNDRSKAKVRLFSLKDIATGDFIDVRGYKIEATGTSSERIIATRVERKNISEKSSEGFKAEISGLIEAVNGDFITVAGHNIKVTSNTQLKGFNNVQAFLSGATGLNVEVHGVIENDVFIAREISLEATDDDESHHSSSSKSSESKSSVSKSSESKASESKSSESKASESKSSESKSSASKNSESKNSESKASSSQSSHKDESSSSSTETSVSSATVSSSSSSKI